MARIISKTATEDAPRIERTSIEAFFKERAVKAAQIGHVQAVIYQDKNPELAKLRDQSEKNKLFPLLGLDGRQSVLDVGCGTGRWADIIVPKSAAYLGTDFSQELIDIANERFASHSNAEFICLAAEKTSFENLGRKFNVILSMGLFIYLNDDELKQTIKGYTSVSDKQCKLLIREVIGIKGRLTLKEHFSEELNQSYNAIYRTEEEILALIHEALYPAGFMLKINDWVFDQSIDSRAETRQKYFYLEKA